jgi:hypothetical protein
MYNCLTCQAHKKNLCGPATINGSELCEANRKESRKTSSVTRANSEKAVSAPAIPQQPQLAIALKDKIGCIIQQHCGGYDGDINDLVEKLYAAVAQHASVR